MFTWRNRGLTFKLIVSILSSTALIFVAIFLVNYLLTRRIVFKDISQIGRFTVEAIIEDIDDSFSYLQQTPKALEFYLTNAPGERDNIQAMLGAVVQNNPEIVRLIIAFDPDDLTEAAAPLVISCSRQDGQIVFGAPKDLEADVLSKAWFQIPKTKNANFVSEPLQDPAGEHPPVLRYAQPFSRTVDGREIFQGVIAADISIAKMQKMVSGRKLTWGAYAMLVSNDGLIITFPEKGVALKETLPDLAATQQDDALARVAREMSASQAGEAYIDDPITGKRAWIFYAPISSDGWSVAAVFQQDRILSEINAMRRVIISLAIAGLVILFIVVVFVSKRITGPLVSLSQLAREIARGNLDAKIPHIRSGDEVEGLARSFNHMRDELRAYIAKLTRATAERERIASELAIAHEIQMGIIPKDFEAIAPYRSVHVAGFLQTAREMGGDLYDVFPLDENRLCFVIADVADKGVHAALVMAITSTLLKAAARTVRHPDDLLAAVNRELTAKQQTGMFVTVFCAVLDTASGMLQFACAGHPPPILLHGEASAQLLEMSVGIPLGIRSDAPYARRKIQLADGDTMLLYTDGITDIVNRAGEIYSEERLLQELDRLRGKDPEQLIALLCDDVREFATGRHQPDDVALLAFRFDRRAARASIGSNTESRSVILRNDLNDIPQIAVEIEAWGKHRGWSREVRNDLCLAVEEMVSNTIQFGYTEGQEATIAIDFLLKDGTLSIAVTDTGRPFNPLEAKTPDLEQSAKDRPIGGLGIHFARQVMDDIHYERVGNENRLTLIKRVEE